MGAFAVRVAAQPAYHPFRKGTIETINNAVKTMFYTSLPRYTHASDTLSGKPIDPDAPPLSFEQFVERFATWVRWWNSEHTMPALEGRTPLQAWEEDPTPVSVVSSEKLWLFTLEDDGRTRKVTTKGVSWHQRYYVAAWMTGLVGTPVRLRYMPNHDHEIEVYHAGTAEHLGRAVLADRATPEQVAAVMAARRRKGQQLSKDMKAAAKARRQRFASSTVAEPPRPLGAMTRQEADAELGIDGLSDAYSGGAGAFGSRLRRRRTLPTDWVVPGTKHEGATNA
jgi:putative transposase